MSIRKAWVLGFVVLVAFAAVASIASAQAILGSADGANLAVVFPTPGVGLPNPTQNIVPGLPVGARPHGVGYYGTDNALISDFSNGRVFIVKISTATLVDTIPTAAGGYDGTGSIAVAPGLTSALASGSSGGLQVITGPFSSFSPIATVALPGAIAGYQTEAIVFSAAGRAFVYNTAGISVVDPPYTSVAFTIPASNGSSGSIAISPDGNTLVCTNITSGIQIFSAPFSASSTAVNLTVLGAGGLDGIQITPDGSTALTVDALVAGQLFAISAPFNASSTSQLIPINATFGTYEDVGISPDGLLAILAGNDLGSSPDVPFVQAPFTSVGATVNAVVVTGGRGAGAVRFLPAGLAAGLTISKSGPATATSGSNITYTITYGNSGQVDATGVVISDPVPVGTTFVSATGGGTLAAGVVTWNIGTLTAGTVGQTKTFTVTINATSGTIGNVNYTIAGAGIPAIPGPPVFTSLGGGAPTPTPIGPITAVVPTLSTPMLAVLGVGLLLIAFLVLRRQA